MDLNLLTLFVTVAETSSFSATALKLNMPKSSVSRGISTLEADLGVRLFHRTTRQVALSTAGVALYERVGPLLVSLDQQVKSLPELEPEPSGEIRVTATADFGSSVLAELVAQFLVRNPAVRIELNITNRVVDLVGEGFDLAFRFSNLPLKDSSLMARKAGPVGVRIFASPAYLARHGTPRTPEELREHEWLAFRSRQQLELEGPDGKVVVEPQGRVVCDDMQVMRSLLLSGAGLGFLPYFVAEKDLLSGELVQLLPEWCFKSDQLWVLWSGVENIPRKVTAFRDFVLDALRVRRLDGRPANPG
jgi:DNA-binding transcriptional LysR family regulator